MFRPNLTQRLTMGMIAVSLCATPTMAAASAPAVPASSRFVALSYLASDASRSALCGNAASAAAAQTAVAGAAAATTAAGQPAPGAGCVLPMNDPVVAVAGEPVAAPVAGSGFSLLGPLIAGLAGLVAVLVLVNIGGKDDVELEPVSPS